MNKTQKNSLLIGIAFSLAGLVFGWSSLSAFAEGSLGKCLMYAGGAIAMCLFPFSNFPAGLFRSSLGKVAEHSVTQPQPVWLRLAIAACWLAVTIGFVMFIVQI